MRDSVEIAESFGGEVLYARQGVLFGFLHGGALALLTPQRSVDDRSTTSAADADSGLDADTAPEAQSDEEIASSRPSDAEASTEDDHVDVGGGGAAPAEATVGASDLALVVNGIPVGSCVVFDADQPLGGILDQFVARYDDRQAIEQIASLINRLTMLDDIRWMICKLPPQALAEAGSGLAVSPKSDPATMCALRHVDGGRLVYVAPVVAGEMEIAIFPRREGMARPDAIQILADGKVISRIDSDRGDDGLTAAILLPFDLYDGRVHRISLQPSSPNIALGVDDFEWACLDAHVRFGGATRGRPLPSGFPGLDIDIVNHYLDVGLPEGAPAAASHDVVDQIALGDGDAASKRRIAVVVVASTLDDFCETRALVQLIQRYAPTFHLFLPSREAVAFARELCRSNRLDQLVGVYDIEQLEAVISDFDDRETIVLAPPRTSLGEQSFEMIDSVCSGARESWLSFADTVMTVSNRGCTVRQRAGERYTLPQDVMAVFTKRAASWMLKKIESVHDGVRKVRYAFEGVSDAGYVTRSYSDDAAKLVCRELVCILKAPTSAAAPDLLEAVEYCRLAGVKVKIVCLIAVAKELSNAPEVMAAGGELLGSDILRSDGDLELLCRQLSSAAPLFALDLPAMKQIKDMLSAEEFGTLLRKVALHTAANAVCRVHAISSDAKSTGPEVLYYRKPERGLVTEGN